MRDPYEVLGLGRDASEADIRAAFRKLAAQHHPDRNQGDPSAQERFTEINERRFAVELTLASREMAAWQDELVALDTKVVELRERQPQAHEAERAAEQTREAANAARAAAETSRSERSRAATELREATLTLRVYHELSHEEIARVLGSSVSAAKANFFHALGNLRRLLQS